MAPLRASVAGYFGAVVGAADRSAQPAPTRSARRAATLAPSHDPPRHPPPPRPVHRQPRVPRQRALGGARHPHGGRRGVPRLRGPGGPVALRHRPRRHLRAIALRRRRRPPLRRAHSRGRPPHLGCGLRGPAPPAQRRHGGGARRGVRPLPRAAAPLRGSLRRRALGAPRRARRAGAAHPRPGHPPRRDVRRRRRDRAPPGLPGAGRSPRRRDQGLPRSRRPHRSPPARHHAGAGRHLRARAPPRGRRGRCGRSGHHRGRRVPGAHAPGIQRAQRARARGSRLPGAARRGRVRAPARGRRPRRGAARRRRGRGRPGGAARRGRRRAHRLRGGLRLVLRARGALPRGRGDGRRRGDPRARRGAASWARSRSGAPPRCSTAPRPRAPPRPTSCAARADALGMVAA